MAVAVAVAVAVEVEAAVEAGVAGVAGEPASEFCPTTAAAWWAQRCSNEPPAAPFRCSWKTFGLIF